MGARTTWEIRTNSHSAIYLYSHWGGESKWADTVSALQSAQPRWSDPTYGARIFISQIIGKDWDLETNFGIAAGDVGAVPFEESYFPMVIDFPSNTISAGAYFYTFAEFLEANDVSEWLTEMNWENA